VENMMVQFKYTSVDDPHDEQEMEMLELWGSEDPEESLYLITNATPNAVKIRQLAKKLNTLLQEAGSIG
jgi:hypothetical protein